MDIQTRLEQDLKTAMLAGDKQRVDVLKGLKTTFQYFLVAPNAPKEIDEATALSILSKEAKKRQDSADMYTQGGAADRAQAELEEKAIIEEYLPKQMDDEALQAVIDKAIADTGATGPQDLGKVIGAVKQQTAGQADGARIAQLVKAKLT